MEYITMSTEENNRQGIIKKLASKEINGTLAATLLNLSVRQTKRLKAGFLKLGVTALIHQSRGKPSNRKMPEGERANIATIIREKYPDFKPTFASEKLQENHNIKRDPKTIRQIMIEEDLWKPKKKRKKEYHAWRQRKECYGQMVQFDGSYHHWVEDRGPEWCLLAAIDDATGIPTKAKFDTDEGVFPVFAFWKEYVQEHGKPHSIYLDKFSTYKATQQVAIENHDTKTQFQRAMGQLGIKPISAHSPQAKGRIERLFKTFQDRLVKELRLAGISTITAANTFLEKEFLPTYAKKYSVKPVSDVNLHRPLSSKEKSALDSIFSRQTTRVVKNDFTVSFNNQWYQILKEQSATVRKQDNILVEQRLDSSIHFSIRQKYLNTKIIAERPEKIKKTDWIIAATKKNHIPGANHPWRHPLFLKTQQTSTAQKIASHIAS